MSGQSPSDDDVITPYVFRINSTILEIISVVFVKGHSTAQRTHYISQLLWHITRWLHEQKYSLGFLISSYTVGFIIFIFIPNLKFVKFMETIW